MEKTPESNALWCVEQMEEIITQCRNLVSGNIWYKLFQQ
jgi:hypothetical protein